MSDPDMPLWAGLMLIVSPGIPPLFATIWFAIGLQ